MKKIFSFLVLAFFAANLNAAGFNSAMQGYIDELKAQAKAQNPSFTDFGRKAFCH